MKRIIYSKLNEWKTNPERKPLLLQGARQVGKTYLIDQFGSQEFQFYHKFNFEQDFNLHAFFKDKLDPKLIIERLSLYSGKAIKAKDSLIFFDEIQACTPALTSLKYFYESAPEYKVIAAGSLLGVALGKQTSFPVGKVNFLDIHPLSFYEYLINIDEEQLANHLLNNHVPLPEPLHDKLIQLFKMHLFLGGMPEVVNDYIIKKDPNSARKIQNEILKAYQRDFSKYNTANNALKISEIWESIPYQMAKENKKFKYSDVKNKTRATHYETAIHWLKSAGLIHVVNQVTNIKLPINGYSDSEKFKIYLLDTGLMGAMLRLTSDTIVDPSALYKEYNGGYIENYVCTELVKLMDSDLFYWTYERGTAEVDFIFQLDNQIIPIEVKSGTNKNTEGLRNFETKFNPKKIFRFSPRNLHQSGSFTNLPLYWIYGLKGFIT